MNRIRHLNAPKLNTNNAYSSFGEVLTNNAQKNLDRIEKKRQSDIDAGLRKTQLKQNQDNADRTYNLQENKFDFTKDKYSQEINYRNKRDKIQDNQWASVFNNKVALQNKPSYSTFEAVDDMGSPVVKLFDKNSGTISDTQVTPYIKPKTLTPEQQSYYQARNEEMQQKRLDNMIKNIDLQYPGIGEDERMKAINYINQNGQMPIIKNDNGWFGKGFFVEMDSQSKSKAKKQLEEDMKLLGL